MNQLVMANPLGSFVEGMGQASQAAEYQNRRRLNALLPQYGEQAMAGDASALNALLGAGVQGLDAAGALHNIYGTNRQMDQGDRRLDQADESLRMEAERLRMSAAEAARQAAAEGRAEEVAREQAAIRRFGATGMVARQNGQLDAWRMHPDTIALARELEIDPATITEDSFDGIMTGLVAAHDGMAEGIQSAVGLTAGPQADPTAAMQNYEYLRAQGVPEDEARARAFSGGVTVNTGDTGPSVGTIPPGYALVEAPDTPAGYRLEPIPGGEAASDAAAAASAETRREGDAMAATDIIVREAMRGIQAAGDRNVGGNIGVAVGAVNPRSDNATLLRAVDALKGIATVEALMAAKQSSATGASGFGALSAQEAGFLQAQIGALDPRSPYIREDMMAATRRILQFVHGYEEGERQFRAQFGAMLEGEGSGFTEGNQRPTEQQELDNRVMLEQSRSISTGQDAVAFTVRMGERISMLPPEERERLARLIEAQNGG